MGGIQSEHLLRPARAAEVIHLLAKSYPLSALVVSCYAVLGAVLELTSAFTEGVK